MKKQLVAGLVFLSVATASIAQSKYKDDVDACNNAFVAAVTAVESDTVTVKFNSGLTRTLSSQEKDVRGAVSVGSPLCLQDDAE